MDDSGTGESLNTENVELKESNEIDASVSDSGGMDSTLLKEQDVGNIKHCDADDQALHESAKTSDESDDGNFRVSRQCQDEVSNSEMDANDDDIIFLEEIRCSAADIGESNEDYNSEEMGEFMEDDDESEDENDYSDYESVLFLSIGNVCRAPMAAAILINLIKKRDLEEYWAVDSAALAELHIKERIDARASKCLASFNVYNCHKCRLVTERDFQIYRYYFCMDELDMHVVDKWLPPEFDKSRIKLLGDLHPDGPVELEDPYDSSPYDDGSFHSLYRKILACVTRLVDQHSDPVHPNGSRSVGLDQGYVPVPIKMSDSEEDEEFEEQEAFIESEEELPGNQYILEDLPQPPEDIVTQEDSKSNDEASDNEEDTNKFVVPHVSPAVSDSEGER